MQKTEKENKKRGKLPKPKPKPKRTKTKKVIIIFGPPGSGKGTQAKMLSEKLAIPHIATGDILRDSISSGSELGKRVQEYVSKGGLVPDDIMIEVVRGRFSSVKDGAILDGFPRTVPQAEALESLFNDLKTDYKVLFLQVPDDEVVKRISGRRICSICGEIYNIYFSPLSRCEKCGGTLVIRDDDEEHKVRKRLEVYRQSTYPLLEFYKKRKKIIKIKGTGETTQVFERILKVV